MKLSLLLVFGTALFAFGVRQGTPPAPEPGKDKAEPMQNVRYSKSGYDLTPLTKAEIAAIVRTLGPEAARITQEAATECAGTGALLDEKREGIYVCIVGGLPLFRSSAKFESGSGWPSFFQPFDPDHVILREDESHGMKRVEVLDARSGSHLGHVFEDGPRPTGLRFCMNSAALRFIPEGEPLPPESQPVKSERAYFAGGCFWGVEDVFQQIPGVMDAVSGYMGGHVERPTYEQVCSKRTGHAEAVEVVFDPKRVSYRELLKVFFDNHDPTTLNRQGPDVGESYRSAIFAATKEQAQQAAAFVAEIQKSPRFAEKKIVTQLVDPGPKFWPAEDYHQDYHQKHGGSCRVKVY
jgi:peptide methionine sulfoxide reductase msrA/msrB